jgi:uncharacterized DUF497 family protein
MRITFDPNKNAKTLAERGLTFDLVAERDWDTAIVREDTRHDYGERRLQVMALLGDRLHVAVVTYRDGAVHVISFRRANRKEVAYYDAERRPGLAP